MKGESAMLSDQKKDGDSQSVVSSSLAGLFAKKAQAEKAVQAAGFQVAYIAATTPLEKEIAKAKKNIAICTTQLAKLRLATSTPDVLSEITWWEERLASDKTELERFQGALRALDTVFANESIPLPETGRDETPRLK